MAVPYQFNDLQAIIKQLIALKKFIIFFASCGQSLNNFNDL